MTAMYPSQVRFDALPRDVMVEVAGVSRTFGSKAAPLHALADVSVRIGRGQLAALVGRSGSGKTTLLNCIGGLDKPDGGTVVIDGATVTKLSEQGRATLRRDQVAFIFQTFGLVPMLSAAENIGLPMRLRKVSSAEREKRVALLLELVGLSAHALQRPGELSGGQQQRGDRQQVMDLLESLVRSEGMTAIISTHDPSLVARADHIVRLADGRLSEEGERQRT